MLMKGKKLKFRFHKSESEKSREEIVQALVEATIKKVLAEQELSYYNGIKAYTS
jgi:hypothetical protein